jgi:hypothetical protein
MNAQMQVHYQPIDTMCFPLSISEDGAKPLMVIVLLQDPATPTSTYDAGPADGELDDEPTWEDAECL